MTLFEYYYPRTLSYSQCLRLIQREIETMSCVPENLQCWLVYYGFDYYYVLEVIKDRFIYNAMLVKQILDSLGYVVSLMQNLLMTSEEDIYIIRKTLNLN